MQGRPEVGIIRCHIDEKRRTDVEQPRAAVRNLRFQVPHENAV
jgi:hypothetical protein